MPQTYGLKTPPLPMKFRQSGVSSIRVCCGADIQFCALNIWTGRWLYSTAQIAVAAAGCHRRLQPQPKIGAYGPCRMPTISHRLFHCAERIDTMKLTAMTFAAVLFNIAPLAAQEAG